MRSGVYGAVVHSIPGEAPSYYAFLSFLRERDPSGQRSRTLSAALEEGSLPEREVAVGDTRPPRRSPCGNGTCDALEKADPGLCPRDCPRE